ncbi:Smr domain protein [Candidatus Fokinia solitaria]|uniref:Smr domain protein n=1 Tax=Candidatus Fokinia solitaria TaxID=1802984 RepID=A0A2U8BRF3_9RICK|nr:Smr/MutS family protein [Candidatus Fokinia solitaria]AWD32850.1 Smr domain protein [Candidatus Fokinia solitaria]
MKIHDECERVWREFCAGIISVKKEKKRDEISKVQCSNGRKSQEVFRENIIFDKVLDLHGMKRDEAYEAFLSLVKSMYLSGERFLLLITGGKGKSINDAESCKRGILRELFYYWITFHEIKQYVKQYTVATQKDGGNGAFYIFIKKRIEEDI